MNRARKEVEAHYTIIDRVLQPLTKGDGGDYRGRGGDKGVIAARAAVQSLQLIRQWARLAAAMEDAKAAPAPKRRRKS